MDVTFLWSQGEETALMGMADSYRNEDMPHEVFWTPERSLRALERADRLAWMPGGHNKFLESITVCFRVRASRAWWSEMDTYRVGTTKQSTSTMHTLSKRPPTAEDFHPATPLPIINTFIDMWYAYGTDVNVLKMCLPEGFLQTRTVTTNYKVLQNIFMQRRGHRLKQWDEFIDQLKPHLRNAQWLEKEKP